MISTQSNTLWDSMPRHIRQRLVWALWLITWLGLLAGLHNRVFYEYVVLFSVIHTMLFMLLLRFQIKAFPLQVRIAYFIWVAVGTYVPYMVILMYITTIGLATNLFLGYCPLARTMYLMPWNREEPFSFEFLKRAIMAAPTTGQFKLESVK